MPAARCAWSIALLLLGATAAHGDDERRLAVEASATVAPGTTLRLDWRPDPNEGPGHSANYFVACRPLGATGWDNEIAVPDQAFTFSDSQVSVGTPYEYRVRKYYNGAGVPDGAYTGYGYVQAGIDVPFAHQRGRVLLFVENSIAGAIDNLDLLVSDLVGDGWVVTTITDFSASSAPADLRARIMQEYNPNESNPALRVNAVFLLGHLPVPLAGPSNPDGHESRPMPADAFYGDVDGDWGAPGNGVYPRTRLPSSVELQVGRVDFANLPVFGLDDRSTQIALLKRYINKDDQFRHKLIEPAHGALVGDGIGWKDGQNPAADAYRNFAPLVGIDSSDVEVTRMSLLSPSWIGSLSTNSYLWVWGSGGGGLSADLPVTLDWLGDLGELPYNTVTSADVRLRGAKGMFYLIFGSYHCNWNGQDALMRVLLGVDTWGLASAWGGRPFLEFEGMGLGETIGEGLRRSENNASSAEFFSTVTSTLQGVHMGLMGDPTLRLQSVEPVSNLQAAVNGGNVSLSWSAPSDTSGLVGFHVYRATSSAGPFNRVTPDAPQMGNNFSDAPGNGTFFYMVRAIKLQASPSGTYFNGSQGIFATATVTDLTAGGASWTGADISAAGGSDNEGPTFSVTGGGSDVWDTSDECRFVYQQRQGDFVADAEVDDLTNTNPWAKAGVMVRESLDGGARNAFMLLTPDGIADFQFRSATNGTSVDAGATWRRLGIKLRLTRSGDTLTGYLSTDGGTTWEQAGSVALPSLANSLWVGLAVTSHASGTNATGTFSNVAIQGTAWP